MYRLNVSASFSAAHRLDGYPGACRRLHGHNWKVRVCVAARELDEIGMALDFKELKSRLLALLDELDHQHLNELDPFREQNPTSERIAAYLYRKMSDSLPAEVEMVEVEVAESENSSVVYTEAD